MKELQEISAAWRAVRESGQAAVLATVVRVDGSAYRKPGARMLVLPDGGTVGSVSGGCLEADVAERARRVMATGQCEVAVYDTARDDDLLFGLGLGCHGIVRVLIERLTPATEEAVSLPSAALTLREGAVMATVWEAEVGAGASVSERLLLCASGRTQGNVVLGPAARRAMGGGRSQTETMTVQGKRVEVFSELLAPPLSLVIFGAGDDAQPLTRMAREMGWQVTVADCRPALASAARFPEAASVLVSPRDGPPPALNLDAHTAAVLMTHNFQLDRALLASLLPSPVRYLGVLGPRRRTQRLIQEIREEGRCVTDAMLSRLRGPIGLDIGAETPEQIALAVVAEIQAALAGRTGGPLCAAWD